MLDTTLFDLTVPRTIGRKTFTRAALVSLTVRCGLSESKRKVEARLAFVNTDAAGNLREVSRSGLALEVALLDDDRKDLLPNALLETLLAGAKDLIAAKAKGRLATSAQALTATGGAT